MDLIELIWLNCHIAANLHERGIKTGSKRDMQINIRTNTQKANPSKDGGAKLKGLKHYAMPASCIAVIPTSLANGRRGYFILH